MVVVAATPPVLRTAEVVAAVMVGATADASSTPRALARVYVALLPPSCVLATVMSHRPKVAPVDSAISRVIEVAVVTNVPAGTIDKPIGPPLSAVIEMFAPYSKPAPETVRNWSTVEAPPLSGNAEGLTFVMP
jgi:hypothetical protein